MCFFYKYRQLPQTATVNLSAFGDQYSIRNWNYTHPNSISKTRIDTWPKKKVTTSSAKNKKIISKQRGKRKKDFFLRKQVVRTIHVNVLENLCYPNRKRIGFIDGYYLQLHTHTISWVIESHWAGPMTQRCL